MSYITDCDNEGLELILSKKELIIPLLKKNIENKDDKKFFVPCLRSIGNIASGSDDQT